MLPILQLEIERSFLPQTDLTLQQDDVTNNTSTPEASNYNAGCLQMHGSSVCLNHVAAGVIGINTT